MGQDMSERQCNGHSISIGIQSPSGWAVTILPEKFTQYHNAL